MSSPGISGRDFEEAGVITAFILLNVAPGLVKPLAERLLDVPGVAEVYSVAGPFDLVAVVRVKQHDQLADLVTGEVAALEGVERTETLISFRAYSKRDLGLMWDLGE
jgi:DNA-binding Lrp family transcriptional regulator